MRALYAALLSLAPLACTKGQVGERPPLRVAAAADLALAFPEVGAAYEKQSGEKLSFTFGSTGLLAKQLAQGAPFDLFAAANLSFVDEVVKAGACDGATRAQYAQGRIVLWTKKGTPAPAKLSELAEARFVKIAIANPEHAPYGKAAKEALEKAGLYPALKDRLVYGENVQQTLQFAQSGNAEAAIVALSLAVHSDGTWLPIEAELHQPLDQALVVCGKDPAQAARARAFAAFVGSEEGRTIMRRYGFLLPGESLIVAK